MRAPANQTNINAALRHLNLPEYYARILRRSYWTKKTLIILNFPDEFKKLSKGFIRIPQYKFVKFQVANVMQLFISYIN
jgi:hypothetical protein